jgi:hypothetical protein
MRTFLLCLLLSLSQCPGAGLAGSAPAPGPSSQNKTPQKWTIPSISTESIEFYKNRFPALVHVVYPDVTVKQACKALRLSGFNKVRILRGGLVSWALNKGRSVKTHMDRRKTKEFRQSLSG